MKITSLRNLKEPHHFYQPERGLFELLKSSASLVKDSDQSPIQRFTPTKQVIYTSTKSPYQSKIGLVKKQRAKKIISSLDSSKQRTEKDLHYESSVKGDDSKTKGQHLGQLLEFLSFYRFREAKFPLISIGMFMIVLLVTLWMAYQGAVHSIPQIEGSVQAFHSLLQRTNSLYSALRFNYYLYIYRLTGSPILADSAFHLIKDLEKVKHHTVELNSNLKFLEPRLQDMFFEENIRMYTDIAPNINTSQSYILQNSISSVYSILEEGLYVAKRMIPYNPADKKLLYAQNYLFNNLYNDFIIKNGDLIFKMDSDISEKVENITKDSRTLAIISISLFCCTTIPLIIILLRIYLRNKAFLSAFIVGSSNEDILKLNHTISHYRSFLKGDLSSSEHDIDFVFPYRSNKAERSIKFQTYKAKKLHTRRYFLVYSQRFLVVFSCCLASLLILISANNVYLSKSGEILPLMNDMTQAGKLAYETQMAVSELPIYALMPSLPVKYYPISYIFRQDISKLSEMTSVRNTNFSPEFQRKVNENFCPYINISAFPNCPTAGKASATQGIIAAIYYSQQALTNAITTLDSLPPGLARIVTMVQSQEMIDLFNMVYSGIVLALDHFIAERASNLIEILDSGASSIIKYSIAGVVVAALVIIATTFYVYPQLVSERRVICRTLLLIPPQMVAKNKLIKEFLLKEAKIFHTYIKDNIEDNNSVTLNQDIVKHRKFIKSNQ